MAVCAHFSDIIKHRYAIHQLKDFLKKQRKRLDNPTLMSERRAEIEANINKAEASIDNHEYEWVSPYLWGDSLSGLRETTGNESSIAENSQPPTGEGEN